MNDKTVKEALITAMYAEMGEGIEKLDTAVTKLDKIQKTNSNKLFIIIFFAVFFGVFLAQLVIYTLFK